MEPIELPGSVHERIVSQLREEHRWLRRLVHSAAGAGQPLRRTELAQSIHVHWQAHAHAEERSVYRLLEGHVQTAEWVSIAREEHAQIDALVSRLLREDSTSAYWRQRALAVASAVDDHMHTEEMGVLSRVPVVLDERAAEQARVRYAKLRVVLVDGNPC